MLSYITLLKAFACFLITNFHFDILYPEKLRLLAFGGDLGNNLFFLISGFTLCHSIREKAFPGWIKRRMLRLLPAVPAANLAEAVLGKAELSGIGDWFQVFLFPGLFWFGGAIFLFYFLIYPVGRLTDKMPFLPALLWLLCSAVHLLLDDISAERYLCGFAAMLAGYMLRTALEKEESFIGGLARRTTGLLLLISFSGYCFLKIMRASALPGSAVIHLGIGILTIATSVLLVCAGHQAEQKGSRLLSRARDSGLYPADLSDPGTWGQGSGETFWRPDVPGGLSAGAGGRSSVGRCGPFGGESRR